MNPDIARDADITDAATLRALEQLARSRVQVEEWSAALQAQRAARPRGLFGGGGLFQPKSATMRAVMSLGKMRLPWLRWAVPAFMMVKSLRRRR